MNLWIQLFTRVVCILVCVCFNGVNGFNLQSNLKSLSISRISRRSALLKCAGDETLSLDALAEKWKIVKFGQSSNKFYGLESGDRSYADELIKFNISQTGGLGIGLTEAYAIDDESGLVLVDEIFPGSNAEKAVQLRVGDSLVGISSPDDKFQLSLEGLNFDKTVQGNS